DQIGTFPLPESQLDRFLMRISLGYPDQAAERAMLAGEDRRSLLERIPPALAPGELNGLFQAVRAVHAAPPIIDYVQGLLAYSRSANAFTLGLSPRAGLGLLASARAWALLDGRQHLLPEDVQAVLPAVAGHRLRPAGNQQQTPEALARVLIEGVALR
ncbi:MAG: MoxR family ATPase, partial [Azovibrio sp.]|nr:MoxR family ATPase [Azovibrio sp.]